ncbi:MAG: hypothetical protein ACKO9H_02720, partial [Planctomycetota bacterium]
TKLPAKSGKHAVLPVSAPMREIIVMRQKTGLPVLMSRGLGITFKSFVMMVPRLPLPRRRRLG